MLLEQDECEETYMLTRRCVPVAIFALFFCPMVSRAQSDAATKAYEKLKKEIEGVAKDVSKYGSNLKSTMASLGKLSSGNQKNTTKAVKSFRGDVESLAKTLAKISSGVKNLQDKRTSYFAEWERSLAGITNADLKRASEERREKVMTDHTKLTEEATELRNRVDAFMKDLNDLSTFLGSDPTGASVSTAKPTIDKVITEGDSLSVEMMVVGDKLAAFAKGTS